ncbi:methane monooxygenase/ammonia monooxygenase subunit B [Smaragdicoccus niigatensis]|uniref:methane monooxygenase/ammonia monooxygenase subunit B n=1 Tax=Smaragdicoccus niigatensis TaxID=359359 RepID=UPI0009DB89B0|nr:methane monooxygenase/ammonia monooxygenase subunit B [Smaragdicoccus niigatensis]
MIFPSRAGGRICRVLMVLVVALLAGLVSSPVASAHGEQTQEAFLRASTVLIYDVKFDKTKVKVGEDLTITGVVRIMDSWPDHTIKEPKTGYLSIVAPGPKFLVRERWLNGQFTPQSVNIHKGETFPFKLVVTARTEGHWHVHPSFAIEGTGTLVGRGEWIDVEPGTLNNDVKLAGGEVVNASTYGLARVATWHLIGIGLAVFWLIFWLRRPIIARLARVESGDTKLITSLDRKVAGGLIIAVLVALVAGNIYANETGNLDPMPLQIDRITPVPAAESAPLVESKITKAEYNKSTDTLDFTLHVKNTTSSPVKLSQLQIAEVTFVPVGKPENGSVEGLTITGNEVAPGQEVDLKVSIDGAKMREHNLLPLKEPQVRLTGLMFFTDAAGHRQVSEIDEVTSPIFPGK